MALPNAISLARAMNDHGQGLWIVYDEKVVLFQMHAGRIFEHDLLVQVDFFLAQRQVGSLEPIVNLFVTLKNSGVP